MATSFTPDGHWFVFDTESGKTLAKGFKSKRYAQGWIARQTSDAAP